MGRRYQGKPVNSVFRTNPNNQITQQFVAQWVGSLKGRLLWSLGKISGPIKTIEFFKHFRVLCLWNRKAIAMWYGLKYNTDKLNRFFFATKNCSKLAVHATTNRYSSFCSTKAVNSLLPLTESRGLAVLARSGLAPVTAGSENCRSAWGAVLPLTLTLLRLLVFKNAERGHVSGASRGKAHYLPIKSKFRVLNSRRPARLSPGSLGFLEDHKWCITKHNLVEPKAADRYRLFEVLADFRFLFVRKLHSYTSSVTSNYRTTNLNLFTYRTHN